jgi:hypothetical protein
VYKFVGFGLLGFLALLIIPVSSSTPSDDPSMYGMATVSLIDESGNVLIENQMHNEVVDEGTGNMMEETFSSLSIPGISSVGSRNADGLCVSNANSFSIADTENYTTFNSANTISGPFEPCLDDIQFILTDTSASTGVKTFAAGTAFADGTTITGIGVCNVDIFAPTGLVDCNTDVIGSAAVLFGVIDIPDTVVPGGTQLEVTYTLNLD